MRASFPPAIDNVVSSTDSRPAVWARLPLVAVLSGVALAELVINRLLGHLLSHEPLAPADLSRRLFDYARLFLYELTAVLSLLLLAAGLARLVTLGRRYRLGARLSLSLLGLLCVLLSALGAVVRLPPELAFHLQLSYSFLALLLVLGLVTAPVPWRLRLGSLALLVPVVLHSAAGFYRRLAASPGVVGSGLDAWAQTALLVVAIATIPAFAVRRRARLAAGLAAVLVGAMTVLVRLDWETAARVAGYGFGLTLPIAPWAQLLFLLALGSFCFTVATLLLNSGALRLRGWGLLLLGLGGLEQQAPFWVTLAAVGFLCLAESVLRAASAPLSREEFEGMVRRGAALLGSPQVVLTGRSGYETARLHAPASGDRPLSLTVSRAGGAIRRVDITIGEELPRRPPFTLARRQAARLGPSADGPLIETGDAAFDLAFATRDRRGLNAVILDDATRVRLCALCHGWLGIWPQRGLHYRARALDEASLPPLLELLRELAARE